MGIVWRVVSFISVWLLYGLIASLFVKNVNRRDYRLLILSGLLGGLIGGALGNAMDVPQNIWWLREFMKLGVTILSMYTCLLYTSPSPRDVEESRMPSSA